MRETNFVLTQQQEKDALEFIFRRETELRGTNADRLNADAESWRRYENDARTRAKKGSIFELSNLHAPIVGLCVDHFVTRAEDDIASESPFFHFRPVGPSDSDVAKAYNGYFNWKLSNKAKVDAVLRKCFIPAFVQRVTILKSVHAVEPKSWIDRDRKILFNKATNSPELLQSGQPIIYGENKWELRPEPTTAPALAPVAPGAEEVAEPTPESAAEPAAEASLPAAEPAAPQNMRLHLVEDPTVIFDDQKYEWRLPPGGLQREEVIYRGGKSVIVPSNRFLCPMDVASPEEADICIEDYDKGLDWIEGMWLERKWAQWATARGQMTSSTAKLPENNGEAKPEQKQQETAPDPKNVKRRILECWIRRDLLGDSWKGKGPQEFVMFVDADTKQAIFYDFQAKVCGDWKRPYTIIAPTLSKPDTWCPDQSLAERVLQFQDAYDKQLNSHLYRNWQCANPIKCIDPSATIEEEEDLIFDPTKVYHLKPNRKIEDFIQFAVLPDADLQTKELGDVILYLLQLWLSVSNVAQGDYSEMPQNNTAHGVEATLQESSKLSRRFNRRIVEAFEEHLLKVVQVTMSTFPENMTETFEYSEGEDQFLGEMTAEDIRDVEINVRLVVSTRFTQQQLQANEQAMAIQDAHFADSLTQPLIALAKRPLRIQSLELLGFRNAEQLLPSVPPPMPGVVPGPANGIPAKTEGAVPA